jgi:hypothetical protein
VPCPHAGLTVGGRCYWCCKQAALNGGRSKLSLEQLGFVGIVSEVEGSPVTSKPSSNWLQPTNPSNIDQQLEELERLRDIAPGWFALAKRILDDGGEGWGVPLITSEIRQPRPREKRVSGAGPLGGNLCVPGWRMSWNGDPGPPLPPLAEISRDERRRQ